MSVVIFIIILGILVFVHEMGHFLFAKLFGIRVDEFGMGFPPRVIRLFKKGGTEYTLNWIPFGGFVKIHGEDSLDTNDADFHRSMMAKKWWQQVIVLIAGVSMNVILAWFIFSGLLMAGAPTLASQSEDPASLQNTHLTVLQVAQGSPAETAGIKAGDTIAKVSSNSAILSNANPESFTKFIQDNKAGDPVTVSINRGKDHLDLSMTPTTGIVDNHQAIGVSVDMVGIAPGLSFFKALGAGAKSAYYAVTGTFKAFGHLVSGKISLETISGPVGLTKMVGDAEKIGFSYVILLTAIISINLAVINILPLPALDGGRIIFVFIEAIIRRPLPKKFVEWTNGIGFSLLILLMLVITVKDVLKLF
jgi:regulator of sigma E protease